MNGKLHARWSIGLTITLAFALTACGKSDEPVAVEETPPPSLEAEAPVEAEAPAPAEDEDTVQSVVEESAAEPEPEEKAIVLAEAKDGGSKPMQQNFKYEEGTHFTRFVPTQPTIGGPDKVEVAEFFWLGCPHCYSLEPFVDRWAESMPANVRLVRVPVIWSNTHARHAQFFYTGEALADAGVIDDADAFRKAAFTEMHQRGNRLLSDDSMKTLAARFGASEEEFDSAWNSFDVDRKMRTAQDLTTRYGVDSVPVVIVNGKYKTSAQLTGGNSNLIEAIDELIARETIR